MVLHGRNGEEFSLRIIDYEFPDIKNDEWDSNWLLIETKVTLDGESWLMTDPCLLTWEVMWLANWLKAISHEDLAIEEVGFLEPNLYCKLVDYNKNRVVIRVFFELENKPKWVEATGGDEVSIDLCLSPKEVCDWVNDITRQRDSFPPRAGVGTQRDIRKS